MIPQASTHIETAKFTIEVIYNGVTKPLEVQAHETVQAALDQAMNLFNIRDQRHLMAFYREEDGTEVMPDTLTLKEDHITPGTILALRPSRVKGGTR